MSIILHSTTFEKHFKLLSKRLKQKVRQRLLVFEQDSHANILNNHPLHGEYAGKRSINITGSFRIIYEDLGDSNFKLHDIGTHSQLYE